MELRDEERRHTHHAGDADRQRACVQQYLLSFAEKAYRHPLSTEEQSAITGQFMTEMNDAGAAIRN